MDDAENTTDDAIPPLDPDLIPTASANPNQDMGQQDSGGDAILANLDNYTVANSQLKLHIIERVITSDYRPVILPRWPSQDETGLYQRGNTIYYREVAGQHWNQDINVANVSKITPEQAQASGVNYSDFELGYLYTFHEKPADSTLSDAQWEAILKIALQEIIEIAEANPSRDTADFIGQNIISLDFEEGDRPETEDSVPIGRPFIPNFKNEYLKTLSDDFLDALIDPRLVWTKEKTGALEVANGPTIIRYYLPTTQEEVEQFIEIFGWESHTTESSPISTARLIAINEAIAAIEAVANIDFQRVDSSQLREIELVFMQSEFTGNINSLSTRVAQSYTQLGQTLGLEATLVSLNQNNDSSGPGSSGLFNALHEIAHAIGLQNPGDLVHDSYWKNTIMVRDYFSPSQPQFFDILALQDLYGANPNGTNADDTVYTFDSIASVQGYHTIYDTSGIDTIDLSGMWQDHSGGRYWRYDPIPTSDEDYIVVTGPSDTPVPIWVVVRVGEPSFDDPNAYYTFGSDDFKQTRYKVITIDLLSLQDGTHVTVAFDTIIENVVGTWNRDIIRGNDADNVLEGGAGSDTLDGRGGSDTASYINSQTGVLIDLSRQQQDFRGSYYTGTDHGSGDELISIENVIGSRHDDILVGNHDNNRLEGRGGDDILTGGPGKDIFVIDFGAGKGHTTITDWERGVDQLFLKVDDELVDMAAAFESGLLSASRPDAHTFEIYLNSAPTEDYLTVRFFDTIAEYSSFRDAIGGAELLHVVSASETSSEPTDGELSENENDESAEAEDSGSPETTDTTAMIQDDDSPPIENEIAQPLPINNRPPGEDIFINSIQFTDEDDPDSLFGMHQVSSSDDRFYFRFEHYDRFQEKHYWSLLAKAGTKFDHEREPVITFDYHVDAHPDVPPENRYRTVTAKITINVTDRNESPTGIFLEGEEGNINSNVTIKASSQSTKIGRVSSADPDAYDDGPEGDPDNHFGEFELTLTELVSEGFSLVSNEADEKELYLSIDEDKLAYTNRLSARIMVADNLGAPEDERLKYHKTFYVDIDHDLELLTPDRWSLREDTPLVFGQAYDNALTISGADGALLDVVIQVDHGSLSTDGKQIGDHATNSTENITTNKHTLTFTGIDEHDLSALLEGLVYTPGANYYGSDELELSVSDGTTTVESTVAVTITPVDDAENTTDHAIPPLDPDLIPTASANPNQDMGQQDSGGDAILANLNNYTVANSQLKLHIIERVITSDHTPVTLPAFLSQDETGLYQWENAIYYREVAGQPWNQNINVANVSKITPEQAQESGVNYSDFELGYLYTFHEKPADSTLSDAQWEAILKIALQEIIEIAEANPSRDTADFIGQNIISLDFEEGERPEAEDSVPIGRPFIPNVRNEYLNTLSDDFLDAFIDPRLVWTKEKTGALEVANGPTIIRYYLPTTQEEVEQFIDIFGWESYTTESSPISTARLTAINEAIAAIEAVANIDFQRVDSSQLREIELVFMQSEFTGNINSLSTRVAQSYTQLGQTLGLEATLVSLNQNDASSGYGSSGLFNALHEISHAIGLQNPGDLVHDSYWKNTIMVRDYFSPSQPQFFDILALQDLYGANPNGTNADDTVYTFDSIASVQGYHTIYDTSGIDTIDLSGMWQDHSGGRYWRYDPIPTSDEDYIVVTGPSDTPVPIWVVVRVGEPSFDDPNAYYTFGSDDFKQTRYKVITIDLLSLQDGTHVTVAFDTIIENVVGTWNRDIIRGNDADNVLEGGAGSDTLDGRGGSDTASYINSQTGVLIDLSRQQQDFRGSYYTSADHGSGDELISIENVIGSRHDDILVGNHDNNRLEGRGGDDILTGGPGKDIFVIDFGAGKGHTTITDWERGVDQLFLKVDDELVDMAAAFENGLLSASRPDAHTFEIYLNSAPTEDYLTVRFFDTIAEYSSFRDAIGGAELLHVVSASETSSEPTDGELSENENDESAEAEDSGSPETTDTTAMIQDDDSPPIENEIAQPLPINNRPPGEDIFINSIQFTDEDDPDSLFGMHQVSSSDDRFYFRFEHYDRFQEKHYWSLLAKAGTKFDHEREPVITFDYHVDAHPDVPPENRYRTVTAKITINVTDRNESPTGIFLEGEEGNINSNVTIKASSQSTKIGRVSSADPDAYDDGPEGDPDNHFGEFELTLTELVSEGFSLVSNEADEKELYLSIDEDKLAYTNRLSARIMVADNLGAPEDERLKYHKTFYVDIDHDLELLTPDRWSLREDTPLVFGQAYDNALTISGADGALLDVVIQVDHGSLSTDGQQIGDHATNSTENTTTNKHTLTFTGIDEHDLSALLEGLVYTPDADYYGSDELEISVSDGTTTKESTVALKYRPSV